MAEEEKRKKEMETLLLLGLIGIGAYFLLKKPLITEKRIELTNIEVS